MKYIYWLVGIVAGLVALVYVGLFTSLGNGLVKPIIESKIKQQTQLPSRLERFSLGIDSIDILLEINKNNTIRVDGTYSLFAQSFDLTYSVDLRELASLESLTQTKLNDSFFTKGTLKGDAKLLKINGSSDVAKSNTTYSVVLEDFNPTSIIAKVDNLDLPALLHLLNQKMYAKAKLNVDVNFKNIKPHRLDGNIYLRTQKGVLNSAVMKKDFNITIPKTLFAMKLKAKLKGDDIDYVYLLDSNLAKIESAGNVKPEPLALDLRYGVNVKELAVLKPITKADIRGPLHLNGSVKGSKEKMSVDGKSDIAASDTTFLAVLKDFAPKSVQAEIKNLQVQKLLYMVKQPHYTDALVDIRANITNADVKNLKGEVTTVVKRGMLDAKLLTKMLKFKYPMPRVSYGMTAHTTLNKNLIDTKVDFASSLANLNVKRARFNMNDSSLESDYRVKIPNLDKLYFVTERHLKGGITANGDVKKAKDLDFTMHSSVAGGKLDAKLHNDDFHADINKLKTLDILDMLLYPKILAADIDAKVDYNLAAAKGKLIGKISNGKFTRNQVLDLTRQYAHIDLYKQIFKGDVSADINRENILASLDLKSNTSEIKTKDTKLNSKTKRIDSVIDINANGNPLVVKLSGNVARPKVSVDASKIIKKEATKAVTKELQKHLGKDVGNLLKGLF
jgi:predicted component of type VI protein secretion system